jgi:hypothetical protein
MNPNQAPEEDMPPSPHTREMSADSVIDVTRVKRHGQSRLANACVRLARWALVGDCSGSPRSSYPTRDRAP